MCLRANNFRGAARAGRYRKSKSMQFDDRGDQAQPQPQPLGLPAFVRAIEALGHRFTFDLGDARTGVLYLDDGLAFFGEAKRVPRARPRG